MLNPTARVLMFFILTSGYIGFVQAEMTREEYAIKFRRSSYTVMGWYYGEMHRMVKGITPYERVRFLQNAERVAFLSTLSKDGFITGSDVGDTKARPEIWSNSEQFKLANDRLEQEAARLVELAKNADTEAIKKQFSNVQKACKQCHDDFKKRVDQ